MYIQVLYLVHVEKGEVCMWRRGRCACGEGGGVHVEKEEGCMWRRGRGEMVLK